MMIQTMRRSALKKHLIMLPVLVLTVGFLGTSQLQGAEHASLWGQIIDLFSNPLTQARIHVASVDQEFNRTLLSDSSGMFQITGLAPGLYTVKFELPGFKSTMTQEIYLEPSNTQYISAHMGQEKSEGSSYTKIVSLDFTHNIHQTVLNKQVTDGLPLAHNVWSMIENLDLSATTNRIDSGGLWSGIPALWGARGGTSWTQNTYMLNGMDVSDPFTTGMPLFYPDYYTINFTQSVNSGHPAQYLSPGGYFDMSTFTGTNSFHGGMSAFFIHNTLQSSNITPGLEEEGLFESHGFDYFIDGNAHVSGAILPDKINYFVSVSAFDLARDLADYSEIDKSSLISGQTNLQFRFSDSILRLFWTGQIISSPSFGAGRDVPFASTQDRKETYNVFQAIWDARVYDSHIFKLGISYTRGVINSNPQTETAGIYSSELFKGPLSGPAPQYGQDTRNNLTILCKGESLFPDLFNTRHKLQYGVQFKLLGASSQTEIKNNIHLHFLAGIPLEVIKYNSPVEHSEASRSFSFFLSDAITFRNFVTLYIGANLAFSQGWQNNNGSENGDSSKRINWLNLAPRAGIIIPMNVNRTSALKISFGRYFNSFPLSYLTYGNPDALGGLVYSWHDRNTDLEFQSHETGDLLRREGQYYSAIDPDLLRPYTDEFAINYSASFGNGWSFFLGGWNRATRNLIRRLNSGVTFEDYLPLYYIDSGDDRIPHTYDDLLFTLYNQKKDSLGEDYYLLTNVEADTRTTSYFGLDLNLIKKFGSRFTFFFTFTAIQAEGSANPGNTAWQNDDSVIGTLFDNPNNLINSKGRLGFDRGYTGRLGMSYLAPWDIRLGLVIKYYDGQPFARKILIDGLNQGPIYIQAHPRGKARYEYNKTIDIRIEKQISIGSSKMRLIFDGFNILNRHWATAENEWTGPEFPLRFATEIQSPRVFRLGLSYEF